jgi:hypothetical protein
MIYGVTTISAKANDYTPLDLIFFFFLLFYTNPFLNKDSCHVGNFREEYSFFFFLSLALLFSSEKKIYGVQLTF